MTTTPTVNSVTTPPATSSSSSSSSSSTDALASLGDNFSTFLTMLTTQLKNQDPTSPLDTNQFTQQLVEMTGVEQQLKTNSQLGTLISMDQTNQALAALPLVGKTVEYDASTSTLSGGSAEFSYTLPAQAASSTISIADANGKIVYQGAGETSSGRHTFVWNGQTTGGTALPDGTYSISVAASDPQGQPIAGTATSGFGQVNGIEIQAGQPMMNIGGTLVPTSKLLSVASAS
jgi:flagellar basal-body rod modification protein FlgD